MFACKAAEIRSIGCRCAVRRLWGAGGNKLQPCMIPFPTEPGTKRAEILTTSSRTSWRLCAPRTWPGPAHVGSPAAPRFRVFGRDVLRPSALASATPGRPLHGEEDGSRPGLQAGWSVCAPRLCSFLLS